MSSNLRRWGTIDWRKLLELEIDPDRRLVDDAFEPEHKRQKSDVFSLCEREHRLYQNNNFTLFWLENDALTGTIPSLPELRSLDLSLNELTQ